jgi:hypothetical protein
VVPLSMVGVEVDLARKSARRPLRLRTISRRRCRAASSDPSAATYRMTRKLAVAWSAGFNADSAAPGVAIIVYSPGLSALRRFARFRRTT